MQSEIYQTLCSVQTKILCKFKKGNVFLQLIIKEAAKNYYLILKHLYAIGVQDSVIIIIFISSTLQNSVCAWTPRLHLYIFLALFRIEVLL